MSLVQVLLGGGQLSLGVLQIPSHGLHLVSGALLVSRLCTSPPQVSPPDLPQRQDQMERMKFGDQERSNSNSDSCTNEMLSSS